MPGTYIYLMHGLTGQHKRRYRAGMPEGPCPSLVAFHCSELMALQPASRLYIMSCTSTHMPGTYIYLMHGLTGQHKRRYRAGMPEGSCPSLVACLWPGMMAFQPASVM